MSVISIQVSQANMSLSHLFLEHVISLEHTCLRWQCSGCVRSPGVTKKGGGKILSAQNAAEGGWADVRRHWLAR